MTRLEFIEAIKVAIPSIKEEDIKDIVSFLDFHIYYDSINTKIRGKIPYKLAKDIEMKYPCDDLGIKAGTIGNTSCPDLFFKDDIYNYELNKNMPKESINSRARRLEGERFKLDKRPNEQKYLEAYRVDTKEGLITLLKEISHYYAKGKAKPKTLDIPKSIEQANIQIIANINPCITGASWIGNTINATTYYEGWLKTNSTLALQELRRALDEFDRSINPFMEGDLSIEEIVHDLKDLKFFIDPFYGNEKSEDEKYYKINLSKKGEKDYVSFGINPSGFDYSGLFLLEDGTYLSIRHYYCYDKKEENQGETLLIEYFRIDNNYKKITRFNITKWTFGDLHEAKKTPSEMEIAALYLDLVKATNLAANLTINNLSRNRVQN